MKNKSKQRFKSYGIFAVIVAAVISFGLFALPTPSPSFADGSGELSVHFVNVGQGDCCIIELPDGKTAIIDGAENKKEHENQIQTFIDNNLPKDFKYFDYAILTHPDSDHCGSLDYVLEKYPSRVCYRPNVEAVGTKSNPFTDPGKADLKEGAKTKDTGAYAKAVGAMYAQTKDFSSVVYVTDPSVKEQTIVGGSGDDRYVLNFYSPLSVSYTDWNDYSPITVLEYRGFKFAITGDAEKENEREFVEKVAASPSDGVNDKYDVFDDEFCVNVFKAGHHGSRTSSSQGLLDVMTTADGAKNAYYIFSCDPVGNNYGHPHQEVIDRISAMGVSQDRLLRTDKLGDLTFTVKLDGGAYALYYGEQKTDAAAGCKLIVDEFDAPSGDGSDENVAGGEGSPDTSGDFIKKYWVYIVIAAVIIIIAIVILLYIHRRNGKGGHGKNSKSKSNKGKRR